MAWIITRKGKSEKRGKNTLSPVISWKSYLSPESLMPMVLKEIILSNQTL
jgi:hypothetical protein